VNSFILSDSELAEFVAQIELCGINAIWYKTYEYRLELKFDDRKAMFLAVLRSLLEQGNAKLQTAGQLLTTSVDEQLMELERAWPPEGDWDDDIFWITKSGVGWTPSGLVWTAANGTEFWT